MRLYILLIILTLASTTFSATTRAAESYELPVSINEVMVALINDAADPIWVAAWKSPETDAQWRMLEHRATQLQLGGTLIAYPGTGGLDHKWTAKPTWRQWANQLSDASSEALTAIKARNIEGISTAGDRIVETCEGCHQAFKMDFPTGGQYGELSPNAADLQD